MRVRERPGLALPRRLGRRRRLADLVVLDRDPFGVAPEALKELQVVLTVAGGRVVYEPALQPSN